MSGVKYSNSKVRWDMRTFFFFQASRVHIVLLGIQNAYIYNR